MNVPKVTIYKIDLQNGNSTKSIRSFECNKTMLEHRIKAYRQRLKSVFERRLNRHITVSLRYKPEESKYDEKFEQSKSNPK